MSTPSSRRPIVPADIQPPLPVDRFLKRETPDAEAVPMDVLFVGGGPAGLAGALELARLVRADAEAGGDLGPLEIGVLEKAAGLGEHCLSGAVVDPSAFRALFPDLPTEELPLRGEVRTESVHLLTGTRSFRIPTPPPMKNHGNHVASICEIVRWLGEKCEDLGVNVFTGFPVDALLMDGDRVVGARTTPAGLGRDGEPSGGYMPPTDLTARVTVLAEGCRGPLTRAWMTDQGVGSQNPQIYALGVKELWHTERPPEGIVHTMGWPLPHDAFGGSWMYPMGEGLVSLGLVVGLDYRGAALDVHEILQRMKLHPLFRRVLEGGELLEWGAKTIPEGGYWSLPERLHGPGLLVAGDAAGLVDVASLKGIHYAMWSGIYAARSAFAALKAGDTSAGGLAGYERSLRESDVVSDLRRNRNMRLAFKSGFWSGGLKAALATVTGGRVPGGRIPTQEDAAEPRAPGEGGVEVGTDGDLTVSKVDAVFRAGNTTRDDIPSHLLVPEGVEAEMGRFYAHMCPAGVYEWDDGLVVNAPNCIDCRATDVLGPRWTPREGGSGPSYKRM